MVSSQKTISLFAIGVRSEELNNGDRNTNQPGTNQADISEGAAQICLDS